MAARRHLREKHPPATKCRTPLRRARTLRRRARSWYRRSTAMVPVVAALLLGLFDSPGAPPPPPPPPITFQPHALLQAQYLGVVRQGQPAPAESGVSLRRARVSVEGT